MFRYKGVTFSTVKVILPMQLKSFHFNNFDILLGVFSFKDNPDNHFY